MPQSSDAVLFALHLVRADQGEANCKLHIRFIYELQDTKDENSPQMGQMGAYVYLGAA
jgi:hypothetical protein